MKFSAIDFILVVLISGFTAWCLSTEPEEKLEFKIYSKVGYENPKSN